jgi:hypothetical protein
MSGDQLLCSIEVKKLTVMYEVEVAVDEDGLMTRDVVTISVGSEVRERDGVLGALVVVDATVDCASVEGGREAIDGIVAPDGIVDVVLNDGRLMFGGVNFISSINFDIRSRT